jgi:hypothetical protein
MQLAAWLLQPASWLPSSSCLAASSHLHYLHYHQ